MDPNSAACEFVQRAPTLRVSVWCMLDVSLEPRERDCTCWHAPTQECRLPRYKAASVTVAHEIPRLTADLCLRFARFELCGREGAHGVMICRVVCITHVFVCYFVEAVQLMAMCVQPMVGPRSYLGQNGDSVFRSYLSTKLGHCLGMITQTIAFASRTVICSFP